MEHLRYFWDPPKKRSGWRKLRRSEPAYYNGGKDEYGGKVLDKAGIDLMPAARTGPGQSVRTSG